MIVDPARTYLYTLDMANNNLHFINTNTEELEKTIFIGSQPVDLDIDESGDTLFVANFGSTGIAVVDLVSQAFVRTVFVTRNPYRVECSVQGRLVYCDEDQWCDIVLVNTDTGEELYSVDWGAYQPDLEMSSDGLSVYAGESAISGGNIYRWDIEADSLVLGDETPGYGYSYPERVMTLSGDGENLHYARRKILASDLSSELGIFADCIYAVTPDGSLAIGENDIFNADTYLAIQVLPITSRVLAVSTDGNTLYIYDDVTQLIFMCDVSSL